MTNKILCWTCEREIPYDVFGPMVLTSSGRASACDKQATHWWKLVGIENGMPVIEEFKKIK